MQTAPLDIACPPETRRFAVLLPLLLCAGYLAITLPLVLHHALWRDEAHAYVFVRDIPSFAEMLRTLRYFGHPPLWYLLLYVLKLLAAGPQAMQYLHLAMAATTIFLVTRYSPFPLIARLLFPFGYYTLFEYGVLARNYQLVLLLTVVFCILRTHRRRAYVAQGVVIALLCLSHVFGIILGAGLGMMVFYDMLADPVDREHVRRQWRGLAIGSGIAIAAAVISIVLILPPADEGFSPDWHTDLSAGHALTVLESLSDAYFPLPPWQEHFWNQSVLASWAARVLGIGGAVVLLASVSRARGVLLFLLISDGGILAFLYTKYLGSWRHHGILFVAALAALWLAWNVSERGNAVRQRWERRGLHGALYVLLAAQVYGAAVAVHFCWHYPFAASDTAAAFLRSVAKPGDVVIVRDDLSVQSLAAYAPGYTFFLPRGSRWGTFTHWRNDFSKHNAFDWADLLAAKEGKPVVLVLDGPENPVRPRTTFLGSFGGGIVSDEWFYFYRVEPGDATRGAGK